ncbi:MAG: phosphoenolpyruvate carboxykinase (ATP) [Candidatus Marinimicrobia bacterium]|nr:phosphoenolpyruvate carboxykinase (ATP) [Candidatus Neomarinimicrobiota bacterium]|tara:strand:- start:1061 stop:2692 length:1632 start_codon:yes stop_codon:yes gene_type:complete
MSNPMVKNQLSKLGIKISGNLYRNLSVQKLMEESIKKGEGKIGHNGALMVDTGLYTGRSPKDKYFVVEETSKENIWWGEVNQKISEDIFNELYEKVINYFNTKSSSENSFIFDGYGGDHPDYTLPIRVISSCPWQAFFCNNMFIRPKKSQLKEFLPEFTIINASAIKNLNFEKHGMNSETFIIFHLGKKIAIIGGTEYSGEMKKGIFSVLHYYLPLKGILSMHCSANVDKSGQNSALFFGLSGTGKTTLSTDPNRPLIGDDEHGWADDGIFNFEGGCYAKTIKLNPEYEPDIYNAIRYGALLENVVYDEESRLVDFDDGSKTENTRVSYPLNHIENSIFSMGKPSRAVHPGKVIFLTCDAYGVLPPVSKLTSNQAMYHFISGYTAKVAGTERGITEPVATFSPCFGGPFLTLHPLKYAQLLEEKIRKNKSNVYFVNTGWVGGSPSDGASRVSINDTRAMITAILDGSIENSEFKEDSIFGLKIPTSLNGIESSILFPRNAWKNKEKYDREAVKLATLFINNFQKYITDQEDIINAGPKINIEK